MRLMIISYKTIGYVQKIKLSRIGKRVPDNFGD